MQCQTLYHQFSSCNIHLHATFWQRALSCQFRPLQCRTGRGLFFDTPVSAHGRTLFWHPNVPTNGMMSLVATVLVSLHVCRKKTPLRTFAMSISIAGCC